MFVRLLQGHPWFRLAEVAASERSAGKSYREATHWLEGTLPHEVAAFQVSQCHPSVVKSRVIFSALDSSVAGPVEEAFAAAGAMVFSNARNHRMDEDVPLVIPEVNPSHRELLVRQRARRGWSGAIMANANCAAIGAAIPLAALHEAFGVNKVFAVTMQAISGAGYPGVAALDILGNVVPFIGGEEDKIEQELQKMLGRFNGEHIEPAGFVVSAAANRVAVENGHTICLSVALDRRASADDCTKVFEQWRGEPAARSLPSSPERPLILDSNPDRPQPRRDLGAGNGMSVTIGRVRPDPIFDVKFVSLSHNTIRGAAGASLLNAELLAASGALPA
jgi:aspartate-semialdehyde dehydrogenase